MNFSSRILCILVAALCFWTGTAQANVVIGGTRVVFSASQGETTLRLSNQGKQPALVEAWIDEGNLHSTPNNTHAPFLITPPLFRMEAGKDQSLRILFTGQADSLPSDRESLFWLNVLEIPPKPKQAADKNILQFAVRSRLKLFYRPANLDGNPLKAPGKLIWKASTDSQGVQLTVHNPTPYYITITKVSLKSGDTQVTAKSGMVAPFGDQHIALSDLHHAPAAGTHIAFTTINDYGAADAHEGAIAAQ
ncbi:molecular chaperone [Oleiagrimonas sp. MCCC 1A03011]|uniref:fimbrial biogenesis chaperone n=1 Tax=Oleiagrimonas sp. MCCC 1A03011 TaxID=1926883 RepID=UPI000DC292EE|nr:molecular chaperone [Oleiagrimonas sp. MCCC 1A03011]RAP58148.1 molecular chaperone EcpD [Oleiagrimonas sp. MCCC 1A03011]